MVLDPPLHLPYHIFGDVSVAEKIEKGLGVVELGAGFGGIEYVQGALTADAELLGQKRHDSAYLIPHQKVTQHRYYIL